MTYIGNDGYIRLIQWLYFKSDFGIGVIHIFSKLTKALIKKALLIAGAISCGALVLATIGVIGLLIVDGRSSPPILTSPTPSPSQIESDADPGEPSSTAEVDNADAQEPVTGSFLRPPARTNFLIAGVDKIGLADAIIVGCFYRDTGDIKMMSVPRDMYTRLPLHRLEQMRGEGLRPPETMKINELRVFGGRNGIYYLKQQLGEMLGVEFHYYVEVDFAAFRAVVDAVDGVYVNVPVRMYYNPPDQDIVIDLSPGWQRLNGAQAEGFVRFRNFPTADLGRNQSQMEFMTQMISQVLTREAIMNEPLTMINIVLNYVSTNIGLNAARYIPYIRNISGDSVTTFVMPGHATYIGRLSWFLPDSQRVPDVVNQIFYAN